MKDTTTLKGLILSGGNGMRLRPLSEHYPKQAMPVGNRPIIHYVVDNLVKEGIVDIGVVLSPETAEHMTSGAVSGSSSQATARW